MRNEQLQLESFSNSRRRCRLSSSPSGWSDALPIAAQSATLSADARKGLKPSGKLITIEKNDEIKDFAISYFKKAGLYNKIIAKTGDAINIITDLDGPFDLV